MRRILIRFAIAFAILTVVSAATFSAAQEQGAWIPRSIESLRGSASSKNGFTFDHSMLVLASKLDSGNDDLRRVIAGVSGVSVQTLHFHSENPYDPQALSAVSQEYKTAGWKQLMSDRDKHGIPGVTDLWIRLENNAVSNVAVLLAKPNEVTFISVSGSISPADLSHLGGHFGIPKIEGGVTVPNPPPH